MFEVRKFFKEKRIVVHFMDKSRGEVPETLVGPFGIVEVDIVTDLVPA